MNLLARITLWLAGLGFIGFGIAFLIDPLQTLAAAGVQVQGDLAALELRAFYGGLGLGLGACLVGADLCRGWRQAGLLLCLASYGSIGLTRGLSMLISGTVSSFMWTALATELGLAALALLALSGDRRLRSAPG